MERAIIDVFRDIVSFFFSISLSSAVLKTIFKIFKHFTNLFLAVCLNKSLNMCNLTSRRLSISLFKFENQTVKNNWEALYLQSLKLALSTKGDYLQSNKTYKQLLGFYNSV
jgi:hypothetical protein